VSTPETIYYRGHFFVINIIVSFHWEEGMGVKGDGVSPILEILADYSPEGEVWCIGIHEELLCPIGGSEYGVRAA
jgi:hypothetical protein